MSLLTVHFLPQYIFTHTLTAIPLIGKDMAYEIEDEVNWSDGPLDPPSPDDAKPHAGPSQMVPAADDSSSSEGSFVPETADCHEIPTGSPVPFSKHIELIMLTLKLIWDSFRVRQTRASHTISCSARSHRHPSEPSSTYQR
jgi:hypothetical protein